MAVYVWSTDEAHGVSFYGRCLETKWNKVWNKAWVWNHKPTIWSISQLKDGMTSYDISASKVQNKCISLAQKGIHTSLIELPRQGCCCLGPQLLKSVISEELFQLVCPAVSASMICSWLYSPRSRRSMVMLILMLISTPLAAPELGTCPAALIENNEQWAASLFRCPQRRHTCAWKKDTGTRLY